MIVLLGHISNDSIQIDVLLDGQFVSGSLSVTLDQWLKMRHLTQDDNGTWCATAEEYAESTGIEV